MTSPYKLRSLTVASIAALLISIQPAGAQSDPDRAVAGGKFPAGWNVRTDRGPATSVKFGMAGDVYRFAMGSAGTFYNADWMKSGNYQFAARLTQTKAPSHPISYGLMFGGSNLAGAMQTYSYFLVRNQGDFFIANREGDVPPKTVVDWTPNAAIVKQGADGKQANTLAVQVQGDNVIFSVNGKEVTRLAKSKVHADGLFGFRIGHNLDVDVDQVKK